MNNIKFSLMLVVLAVLAISGVANADIDNTATLRQAFADGPNYVFRGLSGNLRQDMLDYYDSGIKNRTNNVFDTPVNIDTITPKHMVVKLSDIVTMDLSTQLTKARDTVYFVVKTFDFPPKMSFVSVYKAQGMIEDILEAKWVEFPDVMPQQRLTDWLTPVGAEKMIEIENVVPFVSASMEFDPATGILTATPTLDRLLPPNDYALVKPYLHPSLQYKWTGKKFKLLKR